MQIYNSLSNTKQDFVPVDPKQIKIYYCGPTVYDYAHIGNARAAVVYDVLRKTLKTKYDVLFVSNITDIDDKIMTRAKERGETIQAVTTRYTDAYNADMASLGVDKPDIQPKATEHLPEMFALIQKLIKEGHAYEAEGHVLFHVPSFPNYGKLSGRSRDDQIAGARIDIAPYKKDPADFVLWKPSEEGEPAWDSPFGPGRPGWHIECSAMSEKHCGLPFDIHTGGNDLTFPHHENEIAQTVCAHGHEDNLESYAKYWMHHGMLTVNGKRMGKSNNNFIVAHDLIENGVNPMAIRLAFLQSHYRQPLNWTDQSLHDASKQLDRFMRAAHLSEKLADQAHKEVLEALYDDLNTPLAITVLNKLANEALKENSIEKSEQLRASLKILGLKIHESDISIPGDITELADKRVEAKKNKDYQLSDELRDKILEKGYQIKDTKDGYEITKSL